MRKKIIIINLLIILSLLGIFNSHVFAEQTTSEPKVATIKIGRHQDFIRIVFSTTDDYVQNSSVMLTGSIIKIDFRSPVVFKSIQKDIEKSILKNSAPFEITGGINITTKDSSCAITIENLNDIKVLKLSKPARLVVDAYVSKAAKEIPDKKTLIDEPDDVNSVQLNFFMIDAGHGGYDSGIRGKSFAEKDFVLAFAREFANILAKAGKKALLTRRSDQVLSINERIKSVNQKSPEIFISIHVSSGSEFGIYISDKVRDQGAKNILEANMHTSAPKQHVNINIDSITKAIAQNIRTELGINVRNERLQAPIIAHVNAPAFLIELPNPDNFTYDRRIKEKIINAMIKGLAHSSKGNDSGVNRK